MKHPTLTAVHKARLVQYTVAHRQFLCRVLSASSLAPYVPKEVLPVAQQPFTPSTELVGAVASAVDEYVDAAEGWMTGDISTAARFAQLVHRLRPVEYHRQINLFESQRCFVIDREILQRRTLRHLKIAPRMAAVGSELGIIRDLVEQYAKFLELSRVHQGTTLVPTLGIDLVWHSHMAHAAQYIIDCKRLLGFELDHEDDDSDDLSALKRRRELSCSLWDDMYGPGTYGATLDMDASRINASASSFQEPSTNVAVKQYAGCFGC